MTSQYPDVPKANGVPPVLRQAGAVVNTVVLLAADAKTLLQGLFGGPQWGIFTPAGAAALVGDSVVGVDFRSEWRVSDYPMEQGAFAAYDKVTEPFDVRVTFSNSGQGSILGSILSGGLIGSMISGSNPGVSNRSRFLAELDQAADGLNLYTVVTPEFSYLNCTITHYDYRRESHKGASLIEIDVWLRQIRQVASKSFTTNPATASSTASGSSAGTSTANAQSPSAVDPTNTGTVQASSSSSASSGNEGTTYAYDANGNPTPNSAAGDTAYRNELIRAGIDPARAGL